MLWEECNLLAVFWRQRSYILPPRTRECLHLRQNQELYACERNTYKTLHNGQIQENSTAGKAFRGGGGIASEKNTDWLSIPSWCGCWAPAHAIFLANYLNHVREPDSESGEIVTNCHEIVTCCCGFWEIRHAQHEPGFTPTLVANPRFMLQHTNHTKCVKKDNSCFKSFIYS